MKKLIIFFIFLAPVIAVAGAKYTGTAQTARYRSTKPITDTLKIEPKDAEKHVGEVVTIEGKVASVRVFSSTALLNIGGEYPNQLLTVVLKGDAIPLYKEGTKPNVKATGKVALRNGKPEIVVSEKKDLVITE